MTETGPADNEEQLPACTADELWPVLPPRIERDGKVYMLIAFPEENETVVLYGIPRSCEVDECSSFETLGPSQIGPTIAEALGLMVLWAKATGYLEEEDANTDR